MEKMKSMEMSMDMRKKSLKSFKILQKLRKRKNSLNMKMMITKKLRK